MSVGVRESEQFVVNLALDDCFVSRPLNKNPRDVEFRAFDLAESREEPPKFPEKLLRVQDRVPRRIRVEDP